MGVQGLWTLLAPSARPSGLQDLNGQVVGVDISIWLNQYVRAMRNQEGDGIHNAHLLGLFRRICTLLFHNAKPVFVFDGLAPELKKKTTAARRMRQERGTANLKDTAQKLLSTRLRKRLLEQHLRAIEEERAKAAGESGQVNKRRLDHGRKLIQQALSAVERGDITHTAASRSKKPWNGHVSASTNDIMENQSREARQGDVTVVANDEEGETSEEEGPIVLEEDAERGVYELEHEQTLARIDINSKDFEELPVDVQHELLTDMQEKAKHLGKSYDELETTYTKADDFSSFQILNTLKKGTLQNRLDGLRKTMVTSNSIEGLENEARMIAAEKSKEYILSKFSTTGTRPGGEEENEVIELDGASSEGPPQKRPKMDVGNPSTKQNSSNDASVSSVAQGRRFGGGMSSGARALLNAAPANEKQIIAERMAELVQKDRKNAERMSDSEDDSSPRRAETRPVQPSPQEVAPLKALKGDEQRLANFLNDSSDDENYEAAAEEAAAQEAIFESLRAERKRALQESGQVGHSKGKEPAPTMQLGNTKETSQYGDSQERPVAIMDDDQQSEVIVLRSLQTSGEVVIVSPEKNAAVIEEVEVKDNVAVVVETNIQLKDVIDLSSTRESTKCEEGTVIKVPDDETNHSTVSSVNNDTTSPKRNDGSPVRQPTTPAASQDKAPPAAPPPVIGDDDEEAEANGLAVLTEADLENLHKLESEQEKQLMMSKRSAAVQGAEITNEMQQEGMSLIRLFGLPYIMAPTEAEAQLACLERIGLTKATITEDSDIFLFGAKTVYKNVFNRDKGAAMYTARMIDDILNLDRKKLIALAHILGCDYCEGIKGIGNVQAMEILLEFGFDIRKFREWCLELKAGKIARNSMSKPLQKIASNKQVSNFINTMPENFGQEAVDDAFLQPVVDDNEESFEWTLPDLEGIRRFCRDKLGWDSDKTDSELVPVMRSMQEQKQQQKKITNFFNPVVGGNSGRWQAGAKTGGNLNSDAEIDRHIKSKRLAGVLKRLRREGKNDSDHAQHTAGQAISSSAGPVETPQQRSKTKVGTVSPRSERGGRAGRAGRAGRGGARGTRGGTRGGLRPSNTTTATPVALGAKARSCGPSAKASARRAAAQARRAAQEVSGGMLSEYSESDSD
eukprot:Clim_evm2s144 gene=Clim_evmTU2s144